MKLEWDTSDWPSLNSLHQVCGVTYFYLKLLNIKQDVIYKASIPCSHHLITSFSNLFYHFTTHLPMNFFILYFNTKLQRWIVKGRTDLKFGSWWKHLGIKDCGIYYSPAILFLILFDWMTATSSIILLLKWKSLVSLWGKNNINIFQSFLLSVILFNDGSWSSLDCLDSDSSHSKEIVLSVKKLIIYY